MQTFLPAMTFAESARALDQKRLGKQRVETLQIMSVLTGLKWDKEREEVVEAAPKGWANHPVAKMWRGYEAALMKYQEAICEHWLSLGFKDTCLGKTRAIFEASPMAKNDVVMPPWYEEELVKSHQAALLYKDEEFYSQFSWGVEPEYNYKWPVALASERVKGGSGTGDGGNEGESSRE